MNYQHERVDVTRASLIFEDIVNLCKIEKSYDSLHASLLFLIILYRAYDSDKFTFQEYVEDIKERLLQIGTDIYKKDKKN